MKKIKKTVPAVALSSILLSSSLLAQPSALAVEKPINSVNTSNYISSVNTVNDSVNLSSGKKITQEIIDGTKYITLIDAQGNDEYKIYKSNASTLTIENLQTDEVKTQPINKEVVDDEEVNALGDTKKFGLNSTTQSGYVHDSTIKTNTSIQAANRDLAISLLLAALPGVASASSVIYAVVSHYINTHSSIAYWYEVTSRQFVTIHHDKVRKQFVFYETNLYQNYLNTETTYYDERRSPR